MNRHLAKGLTAWLRLVGVVAIVCCGCSSPPDRSADLLHAGASLGDAGSSPVQPAPSVRVVQLDASTTPGQTTWQIVPVGSTLPQSSGKQSAVLPHIERRMSSAFNLAQRGATYSAYLEFQSVLRLIAAEFDEQEGGARRRQAIQDGFVALKEVEEFTVSRQLSAAAVDIARISSPHRTPLQARLKEESWDVESATREYYQFAMTRIGEACQGSQAAANALYGMGRTSALLKTRASHGTLRALLLYDLATQIDPTHSLAANELGVMFAQNGRFEEAEQALRLAVAHGGCSESWKNLAIVTGTLGKTADSELAWQKSRLNAGQVEVDARPGKEPGDDLPLLASGDSADGSSAPAAPGAEERRQPDGISSVRQRVWKTAGRSKLTDMFRK